MGGKKKQKRRLEFHDRWTLYEILTLFNVYKYVSINKYVNNTVSIKFYWNRDPSTASLPHGVSPEILTAHKVDTIYIWLFQKKFAPGRLRCVSYLMKTVSFLWKSSLELNDSSENFWPGTKSWVFRTIHEVISFLDWLSSMFLEKV